MVKKTIYMTVINPVLYPELNKIKIYPEIIFPWQKKLFFPFQTWYKGLTSEFGKYDFLGLSVTFFDILFNFYFF